MWYYYKIIIKIMDKLWIFSIEDLPTMLDV